MILTMMKSVAWRSSGWSAKCRSIAASLVSSTLGSWMIRATNLGLRDSKLPATCSMRCASRSICERVHRGHPSAYEVQLIQGIRRIAEWGTIILRRRRKRRLMSITLMPNSINLAAPVVIGEGPASCGRICPSS